MVDGSQARGRARCVAPSLAALVSCASFSPDHQVVPRTHTLTRSHVMDARLAHISLPPQTKERVVSFITALKRRYEPSLVDAPDHDIDSCISLYLSLSISIYLAHAF